MISTQQQITIGSRVRVQLPYWDGPGCLVYTVESFDWDRALVREPRVPGLGGDVRWFSISELVTA